MSTGNPDDIELSRVRGTATSEPLDDTKNDPNIEKNDDIMVRSGINEAIDPNKQLTFAVDTGADAVDGTDGAQDANIADITLQQRPLYG